MTLVTSLWPQRKWFSTLLELLVDLARPHAATSCVETLKLLLQGEALRVQTLKDVFLCQRFFLRLYETKKNPLFFGVMGEIVSLSLCLWAGLGCLPTPLERERELTLAVDKVLLPLSSLQLEGYGFLGHQNAYLLSLHISGTPVRSRPLVGP